MVGAVKHMKMDIIRGENGEMYLPLILKEKESLSHLSKNIKSLDKRFQEVVDDNFWELIK